METYLCVTQTLQWMNFPEIVYSMVLEEGQQGTGRGDHDRECREGRRHPGMGGREIEQKRTVTRHVKCYKDEI